MLQKRDNGMGVRRVRRQRKNCLEMEKSGISCVAVFGNFV